MSFRNYNGVLFKPYSSKKRSYFWILEVDRHEYPSARQHGSISHHILQGRFNDISSWRFERLGEVFGPLQGFEATSEQAFEQVLQQALDNRSMPNLINVHLGSDDASAP